MRRRPWLQSALGLGALAPLLALAPHPLRAQQPPAPAPERFAAAWRRDGRDCVVLLHIDWRADPSDKQGALRVVAEVPVPTRAHGLTPLPDGGVVAVAQRPGRWLLRLDAQGAVVARRSWPDAPEARTLNGHAELACKRLGQPDVLCTSETDPRSGRGFIALRDLATLAPLAHFDSQGLDPHQMLLQADGSLWVAHGGLARDRQGRRLPGTPIESALVKLDATRGELLDRWTLPDPELSLRHLAASEGAPPQAARLGIALQAEHTDPAARACAPLLAVLEGGVLKAVPARCAGAGYAGDIVSAPGGGFVVSAQKARSCWLWTPDQPDTLQQVAHLHEACALAPSGQGAGVAIGAARGAARWHAHEAPVLLPWPAGVAPDNHWVRLASGHI